MGSEPGDLTASEAVAAIAQGRLAPTTLLASCLARIAARDPTLKSFLRLNPSAQADAAAAPRGALGGVPIAIKDLIDTAGLTTEYGTRARAGHVPRADAACVARLKAEGAIVIGKTTTTELAHVEPTATVNPWDERRTPGGSSSGSAAAVGAGLVPIALGTQTGGSVIRPASYCGTFGFKSSWGRTDTRGVHELAGSLDTVGWMTRSAEDLLRVGGVLLERPGAFDLPARPVVARLATPYDHLASPTMRAACARFATGLARAGAEIVDLDLAADLAGLNELHRRLVSVEAARAFASYPAAKLSARMNDYVAEGRRNEPAYDDARDRAEAARATFARRTAGVHALICPAATGEAPLGLDSTGDAAFSLLFSLLRLPSATLPFARGEYGMPIGVQLVGRFDADETLLAVTRWAAERLAIRAGLAP